jgi:HD domain
VSPDSAALRRGGHDKALVERFGIIRPRKTLGVVTRSVRSRSPAALIRSTGFDNNSSASRRLLGRPEQALLTAIVIVADWIASNVELFPLDPPRTAREPARRPESARTAARVAPGWAALDLPSRWSPGPLGDIASAFRDRFGKAPRPGAAGRD